MLSAFFLASIIITGRPCPITFHPLFRTIETSYPPIDYVYIFAFIFLYFYFPLICDDYCLYFIAHGNAPTVCPCFRIVASSSAGTRQRGKKGIKTGTRALMACKRGHATIGKSRWMRGSNHLLSIVIVGTKTRRQNAVKTSGYLCIQKISCFAHNTF